jgi:hypothetical protein
MVVQVSHARSFGSWGGQQTITGLATVGVSTGAALGESTGTASDVEEDAGATGAVVPASDSEAVALTAGRGESLVSVAVVSQWMRC